MKILALDLGTKTGWCYGASFNGSSALIHGTNNFSMKKGETRGHRFLNFHMWLRDLIKKEKPDKVYYEDVKNHGKGGILAAHCYGGLLSQVLLICVAHDIECIGVGVGTIKKHATGKGNAKKDKMIEAAIAYGHTPEDDNSADSICLWYYAIEGV